MFNRLYQQNADYFRQLTLYIIAGDEKLEQVREGELKALLDKAMLEYADLRGAEMNYTQFGTAFLDNAKLDK
jgi:uncharacterized protein YjbI with pentapeptide repeats